MTITQAQRGAESQWVESYRFSDVLRLWARERLVHEIIVAGELLQGIVAEGLRFQSVDPRWLRSSETLRGDPLVGYAARAGEKPVLLRAAVLQHVLAVTGAGVDPDPSVFAEEFVTQGDFRQWLVGTGRALPRFWFAEAAAGRN